jgi:hypothetical protein
MNDPSEEFYFDHLIKELIDQEGEEVKFIQDTLYNLSYHKAVLNPTEKFIASFSKNGDSLPMWNYYSKGNGYNFEIDLQDLINRNISENLSIRLIELNYDKQNHLKLLKESFIRFNEEAKFYSAKMQEFSESSTENHRNNILGEIFGIEESFNDELDKLKISFKHPAYAREEEVRLIISESPGPEEGEKVNFKISNSGVFISYIALQMDLCKCISSITTHPLNSNLYKLGVEEFLKSDYKFKNIQVKESEIPFREI